jgi:glutathione S-transferase
LPYRLYYWPSLPGRGEFVRMILEDVGAEYDDVARREGVGAVVRARQGALGGVRPFAPPVLVDGEHVVAQTAAISLYLGERHGLLPADAAGRSTALQHLLTVADLVAEAHDTHHPLGKSRYYEDQVEAAKERAAEFRSNRLPVFLTYLESVLRSAGGAHFVGGAHSVVDLHVAHVLAGLRYAFPNTLRRLAPEVPALTALAERVVARPNLAAYLASPRRLPFNEDGIFRRYPELDPA